MWKPLLLLLGLGSALLPGASPARPASSSPLLLYYSANIYKTWPSTFQDQAKVAYMDSLPFDGVALCSLTGWGLMDGLPIPMGRIEQEFLPMRNLKLKHLTHNFCIVSVNRAADFFDDWSITVANFKNLAIVLKRVGIKGIFFDNETYAPKKGLFNFPDDCRYPAWGLESYEKQARLRGKEIMQAMVSEYPEITVLVAHGPYVSCTSTPAPVRTRQSNAQYDELMGPFFVGFMEGMGPLSTLVDGGEIYAYRTREAFEQSYAFRKEGIASQVTNCSFIPSHLRRTWKHQVSIAFGVFNEPFPKSNPMSPAILRQTLAHALRRCDRYAWLYTESRPFDFLSPQGLQDPAWLEAVRQARMDAGTR